MHVVTRYGNIRQRGIGLFAGFLLFAWLLMYPSAISAGQNSHVKILYYFSVSCKHCIAAKPSIIALSKEFNIEGRNAGTTAAAGYPFPVKTADKKIAKEVYGIQGVPTLAVLINGAFKQKIAGTPDIQDAAVIIKALSGNALTVTEAAEKAPEGDIIVTGWIVARGASLNKVRYFITDRRTDLPVKVWLPIEAMKGLVQNKRPRLMSDVVKKPVVLKGGIQKTSTGNVFVVKEEEDG